jgi:hypothetical protein
MIGIIEKRSLHFGGVFIERTGAFEPLGGKIRSEFGFCNGVLRRDILLGEIWNVGGVQKILLLLHSKPVRIRMIPILNMCTSSM